MKSRKYLEAKRFNPVQGDIHLSIPNVVPNDEEKASSEKLEDAFRTPEKNHER